MLILPDYGKPYIIDSLTAPIVVRYHWIFNGPACDFMLQQISYLEETTGGALQIRVNGTEFWVPATWNILVTDAETCQLDTVTIKTCASKMHSAFCFSTNSMNFRTLDVTVLDAVDEMSLVHPMIMKATALVHPVGPSESEKEILNIVIGPHDLYKYLSNKVVGDIFS
jgi:hypothetical protein